VEAEACWDLPSRFSGGLSVSSRLVISRTLRPPGEGHQKNSNFSFRESVRVARRAVVETTRFCNRTRLSSCRVAMPVTGWKSAGTELCRSPRSPPGHDLRLDEHGAGSRSSEFGHWQAFGFRSAVGSARTRRA